MGTRCSIVLLEADSGDDGLLLQLKEAGPSVLEPYLSRPRRKQHAARVVTGQRLMQASSGCWTRWRWNSPRKAAGTGPHCDDRQHGERHRQTDARQQEPALVK